MAIKKSVKRQHNPVDEFDAVENNTQTKLYKDVCDLFDEMANQNKKLREQLTSIIKSKADEFEEREMKALKMSLKMLKTEPRKDTKRLQYKKAKKLFGKKLTALLRETGVEEKQPVEEAPDNKPKKSKAGERHESR